MKSGFVDSRLYPLGAFFLTLLMTAGFFGLVEYIFGPGPIEKTSSLLDLPGGFDSLASRGFV